MAQVYRRVRLLVSPTIVGVQLTDQQRTAQAPRDAQPEIANAKRRLTRVAQDLRDEYRKGLDVAQLPTYDGELAAKQLNELRG